jgi:hypothetical protein
MEKDPDSVLDFAWDWSEWLHEGETIFSASVSAPDGITVMSSSFVNGLVTAWLADGELGRVYPVLCRITTNQGRVEERTLRIRIAVRVAT